MKVLIVYDTVSPARLTAKVAETISAAMKEKGAEVDSFFVKDVDKASLVKYDCLVAGGPTVYFRASRGIMQFLDDLRGKEVSGKMAAAFDTQLEYALSGSAAKGIDGKLRRLGFKVIAKPLVTYVEGKMNETHMKEGELERAKSWAQTVAEALSK
jgi:flavodoxin